jgi:hypothetical protein
MAEPTSPYEAAPPSPKRLWRSVGIALLGAALVLVTTVLPAEYGIDPIGTGRALGLTALNSAPSRTIEIKDVIGGNEQIRKVKVPDPREPVPLPNPAVHQDEATPARTETRTITLQANQETEVKLHLAANKVALYAWKVDRGQVYVDFHGHDPALGPDFWVRYKEEDAAQGDQGSLVAPLSGEHGWYWQNYNDFPVVITLTVSGYYDNIIDYGIR